jgi:hypothetical protein
MFSFGLPFFDGIRMPLASKVAWLRNVRGKGVSPMNASPSRDIQVFTVL